MIKVVGKLVTAAKINVTYLAVLTHVVLQRATIPKDIMGKRNFSLIDLRRGYT